MNNKQRKKLKRTYDRWKNFNPRGDKCPICKADFRTGCNHTVQEADHALMAKYFTQLGRFTNG